MNITILMYVFSMRSHFVILWALLLAVCIAGPARAQPGGRRSPVWYTLDNGVIVQRSGTARKVLADKITLPNGNRLEPRSHFVYLPNGQQEVLNLDDMVLASGEIIRITGPVSAGSAPPADDRRTGADAARFSYQPPAPVNGLLKGVVELGASGFNSFIVRIDGQHNWKLEKAEFGNSLVMENLATPYDISRGLKSYIGQMLDFGVAGRNIHFVVSSGAALSAGTAQIVSALKGFGYVVHTVTPAQEGVLDLRATLPPPYAARSFVVDMGSANTKVSWLDNDVPSSVSTHGSKYYQQALSDSVVAADVAANVRQVPAGHRQTCFLIGGVPFELAKDLRQGKESYTVLRPAAAYAQLTGAKSKAGLNIYRALASATGCEQFVFSWDANFSIGYLLAQP